MSKLLVKCMCGIELTTASQNAGMVMVCPHCKQQFRVPGGSPSSQAVPRSGTGLGPVNVPQPVRLANRSSSSSRHRAPVQDVPVQDVPVQDVPVQESGYTSFPRPPAKPRVSDKTIRLAVVGSITAIVLMFLSFVGWMAVDRIVAAIEKNPAVKEPATDVEESSAEPWLAESSQPNSGSGSESQTVDDSFSTTDAFSTNPFAPPLGNRPDSTVSQVSDMQPNTDRPPSDISFDAAPTASASPLVMADLIDQVEPSVVRIDVVSAEGRSLGSGSVIDASGLILTNYHVIEGAQTVKVTSKDGQTVMADGYLVADPTRDLCILRVDPSQFTCHPLPLASEPPRKGTSVAAFGSPEGFDFSATNGIVSAYRTGQAVSETLNLGGVDAYKMLGYTADMDWVQTSAAISSGNSGGPLVNMYGEIVGVNTFKHNEGQNLNFAVAISTVRQVLARRSETPTQFASLPKPTSSDVTAGVLAFFFGVESIVPAMGQQFEKVSQGSSASQGNSQGNEVRRYTGHKKAIIDLAIASDGGYLAAASLDDSMSVFEMSSGKVLYTIETTAMPIRGVAFSQGSNRLTTLRSAGLQPSIVFRNPENGRSLDDGIVVPIPKEAGILSASEDGRSVFGSWIDGTQVVRRYDALLSIRSDTKIRERSRVVAAAVSNDGKHLMTAYSDSSLQLRDIEGDRPQFLSKQLEAHQGSINKIVGSPDSRAFASGGGDGSVSIWRSFSRDNHWRQVKLLGDSSEVISLAFSPDSKRLAIGRANGKLEIWNLSTKKMIQDIAGHEAGVSAVEFFANGEYVVSGSTQGTLRIFHIGS